MFISNHDSPRSQTVLDIFKNSISVPQSQTKEISNSPLSTPIHHDIFNYSPKTDETCQLIYLESITVDVNVSGATIRRIEARAIGFESAVQNLQSFCNVSLRDRSREDVFKPTVAKRTVCEIGRAHV